MGGLAENLGKQQRWAESAEAYTHALSFSSRMFGEADEHVVFQRQTLARIERLARYQRWIYYFRCGLTLLLPVFLAWAYKYFEWNLAVWSFGIALGLADPPNATDTTLSGATR